MKHLSFTLIDEQEVLSRQVIQLLADEQSDSSWAKLTNPLAIHYAQDLTDMYGEVWVIGRLPEALLFSIHLPEHRHALHEKAHDPISFPLDTNLEEAVRLFHEEPDVFSADCHKHISHLKDQIEKKGFVSTVALVLVDHKLKHVDGLHRLIALGSLIKEGYEYRPISTLLCRKS